MKRLIQMNQECIRKNISSGGAADQLALTLFLWQAVNEKEIPVYCPVCIE
nr:triphosphoribosyl-dephospho-CoA synthase [uncultured Dorea sp.]